MDLAGNLSNQEPLPRLRELCMIAICDKYSTDEIKQLHLPTEVKEVLLQKKNLDNTFNKLSSANGRGLHTAMYLFASRGKEILPYLNEKLLSAKSWRERLLVKAIKAMILNEDLMLEHNNHDNTSFYSIIPKYGKNAMPYTESGPGLICDYVLARILCMMPIDPSTWRSLDGQEDTPQEVYCNVFDGILRHYDHPEAIPALVWTLVHLDLPMNTYETLFRVLSASQKSYLVQIIQTNVLKMTVEQMTRVMRVVAAVNEQPEIASHSYAEILQSFMETHIAYLLSSEHLLIESIFNGFGVLQYMPGLEFIFKTLLIAVEQYRNSAVFSAKLLSPGIIRQSIIKYGDKAVPFLQETINNADNLMAQVVGHGLLFEIECALAAHDFYQTVTEYLEQHRMSKPLQIVLGDCLSCLDVNGTGYVAFHQASHRYQIDFIIPSSLKVPFYLHCEAFLTHRKINPATAPCFIVNEFGRKVLAKRFTLESPHVQVKILDSLVGYHEELVEFFLSVLASKLDLKVLLKLIEVSILSATKSETVFSLLTEKLNQLAAKSDAQKVLYGHELLNHLAPFVLSLSADVHVIPAETLRQILSTQSDLSGEYSLHYFCAHYLIQFHKNFTHLDVILRAICASSTGRDIARELYNVAKDPLFAEAIERQLSALKKTSTPTQSKSIITKSDEFNMDDVKCRVLCEYLLIKLRNVDLYNNFRLGMEKPRPSFSQRGGPQLADFERAARFFLDYPEDVPLLEYEVMFPDLKAVYHPSLAALALAHLKSKSSLPVLINFLYSTHYDIKVPYRALELYGEEAAPAIKSIVDKTTDKTMANSLRKVLQQISHKQMSLDNVLATIEKYTAESMPKSDLLSCLEAVKNYPDNVLVKVLLFKWIPLQTDMEIKSRAIEIFWSWKVSGDIADFCSEHLQYYDKENNINLAEPAFKVFSAHTGVESGVRFLINKLANQEHASGCLLGIGKIYENAYICHERDFGPFSELRYSQELKELVLGSVLDVLNNSTQKSKQTNDTAQSAIRALRAIVQLYQTRPYPEDDVFDLKPVMNTLQATSKRLALHWPLQQLLISTVVKMCFTESMTGPGQITDRSGIEVILTCIDEQLSILQRREDINWLARTVQDFLATSKDHRAVGALLRLYEITEYQNTRLAELLCSFEDPNVIPAVQQGLVKLLGKLSVTYQELASYLRGLLQLQQAGQQVLVELVNDTKIGLKERCQIVLALAQHGSISLDQIKYIYWEVIDMGLYHPGLPYDNRKHAYQTSLEYLSQSLVLLDSTYASQSLRQALMIYSGDEDVCSVLESALNQITQQSTEGTTNLVLDNKYLPNAVLEWAKKNKPSDFDENYYKLITTLKETLRTTDKNQIRVNKKIMSQDLTRTAQLFIDMYYYSNTRLDYDHMKSTILRLNNTEHEAAVELCFSHYSVFTVHQLLTELDQQLSAHTKHHLLTIVNTRESSPWWLVDRVKVGSLMKVLFGHLTGEQVSAVMTEENKQRIRGIKVHHEDFVWATRLQDVLALLNKT